MHSKIRRRVCGFFMAILAVVICGFPMSANAASRHIFGCVLTKMKVAISDGVNSTTSGSFQTIAGSGIAFAQGGAHAGCVTIELQAQAYAPTTGNGLLSLNNTLDGQEGACLPNQPQFSANNGMWAVVNNITFYCENVAPGTHRITLEFRSANGGSVELNSPIITVRYQ